MKRETWKFDGVKSVINASQDNEYHGFDQESFSLIFTNVPFAPTYGYDGDEEVVATTPNVKQATTCKLKKEEKIQFLQKTLDFSLQLTVTPNTNLQPTVTPKSESLPTIQTTLDDILKAGNKITHFSSKKEKLLTDFLLSVGPKDNVSIDLPHNFKVSKVQAFPRMNVSQARITVNSRTYLNLFGASYFALCCEGKDVPKTVRVKIYHVGPSRGTTNQMLVEATLKTAHHVQRCQIKPCSDGTVLTFLVQHQGRHSKNPNAHSCYDENKGWWLFEIQGSFEGVWKTFHRHLVLVQGTQNESNFKRGIANAGHRG